MNSNDSKFRVETEQLRVQQMEAKPTYEKSGSDSLEELKLEDSASAFSDALEKVETESAPQQFFSELSFACLLIPRFNDHFLIGNVTGELVGWMKQICISYGWRLDAIMVRPGYLQWVMIVPANANPAQFMRIIRQHTSQKIFEDFPRFRRENVSGQFWAPGNFVVAGHQLQIPDTINNFILQTRRYQGIA